MIFLQRVRVLICCSLASVIQRSSLNFIVSFVANLVLFSSYLSLEVKGFFFFVHVLRCSSRVCCKSLFVPRSVSSAGKMCWFSAQQVFVLIF